MYSRARWLAGVPTARLPMVPASMPTCARAFCSENSPGGREQEADAAALTSASSGDEDPPGIEAGYLIPGSAIGIRDPGLGRRSGTRDRDRGSGLGDSGSSGARRRLEAAVLDAVCGMRRGRSCQHRAAGSRSESPRRPDPDPDPESPSQSRSRPRQRQPPGVERHADDGVDAEAVERVDFLLRRDAAGGGQRRATRRARTASMAAMSVPCIRPSRSTWV